MADKTIPERDWTQVFKEEKEIDIYIDPNDPGHYKVRRFLNDGTMETFGHIYIEVDGDYIKYISTGKNGREIFSPTTDFNEVIIKFERLGRSLAQQEKVMQRSKQQIKISPIKNPNQMNKVNDNSTQQKPKRENQLIFIEYEKAKGDGHNLTIVDSYHNVIGRGHRIYNDETKKYEYFAYDHAGNLMFKSEKQWELKNEFVKNRTELLEEAHQRRIASKEQSRQNRENGKEEKTMTKAEERKRETEKLREDKLGKGKQQDKALDQVDSKSNDKSIETEDTRANARDNEPENEEQSRQDEREQELDDLRSPDDDYGIDMDR